MNMDAILDEAIEKDASDIHLICTNKPMLRISRRLEKTKNLKMRW